MTEVPAPYVSCPAEDLRTPLAHFFAAAGCRTQAELAAFLNVQPSSVADAKRRGSLPAAWLLKLLQAKRVNPEWVQSGQGPRFLQPAAHSPAFPGSAQATPPAHCSTPELIYELARRAGSGLL